MRGPALREAAASRCGVLVLAALVVFLCAPVRTLPTGHQPAAMGTPLTLAVASALAAPEPASTSAIATSPAALGAVTAPAGGAVTAPSGGIGGLTARLLGGRAPAALPPTLDVGAVHAATPGAIDPALRSAGILGEHPDPVSRTGTGESVTGESVNGESVTGAAVAFGAPDAGNRGGAGPSSIATAGSAGGATATLGGLAELPVHDGFTVARDATRTGTIHTSIQPLDRPG